MDQFDKIIQCVRENFAELISSPKLTISHLPKEMPGPGIYLFSERGIALYVGRTNTLRKRLQYHTRNNHNQATFAFLLARHQTGKLKASYRPDGSRAHLLQNPIFRSEFDEARERIRQMAIQFVEEPDPIKQSILEIYTAFQTKAVFNDFDNH
ncbi:MAG: GIY-YIG nuclease family protein [bacterium]|nr:GIY-YIG nuclease family protein [bacterium]